ncbi:hypothetical protein [Variovorax sp. 770b2]|uniref:hypothetical protein n=1 Tax=Variovorax sp. 770b2 TaxID=1566271 RepID=UPI0008F36400|nr:hypothetical protein [Variovorax sp. 770b2]SFQ37078.1 hypothetical protein SAMN03159339_0099 [Variovorax sp. 770b2]
MFTAPTAQGSMPSAKPVVLDARWAVAIVLVPLNPRGICEANAIRIGLQLWLVTQWQGHGRSPGIWRPVRIVRLDEFDLRPMGERLVLVRPMASRVFRGKKGAAGHEVVLDPQILVDFGRSLPVAEAAARRRSRVSNNEGENE